MTAWNCKSPQCTTEGQTIGHPGCCSPISGFREFSFPKEEILIFERTTLLHPPRQNQKGRTCRRWRVSFQPTTQIVRQTCQASCRSVQANNVVRGSCWLLVSRVLNGLCRRAGRVQVTPEAQLGARQHAVWRSVCAVRDNIQALLIVRQTILYFWVTPRCEGEPHNLIMLALIQTHRALPYSL